MEINYNLLLEAMNQQKIWVKRKNVDKFNENEYYDIEEIKIDDDGEVVIIVSE